MYYTVLTESGEALGWLYPPPCREPPDGGGITDTQTNNDTTYSTVLS